MHVDKQTTRISGYLATDGDGARRLFLSLPTRNTDTGPLGPFNCWYAKGYPEVLRIPEKDVPEALKNHAWEHAPVKVTITIEYVDK